MVTQTTVATLPIWDLSSIFPSIDSPEFEAANGELAELIETAEGSVGSLASDADVETVDHWLTKLTRIAVIYGDLEAFLDLQISADSRDTVAQGALSVLLQVKCPDQ